MEQDSCVQIMMFWDIILLADIDISEELLVESVGLRSQVASWWSLGPTAGWVEAGLGNTNCG